MEKHADLERTLQELHESGIAAGIESCPRDGMVVWSGDDTRKVKSTKIEPSFGYSFPDARFASARRSARNA